MAYSAAANAPMSKHPFPIGTSFAQELGYPRELLDMIPSESAEAFAGVSDVSIQAPLREGAFVLDLGCGAGLDSLVAAERVGANGRIVGLDFSASMLNRANSSALRFGRGHVMFLRASAEQIPVRDSCVDIALVNGIFNLNPFRERIFHEIFRVLRPGAQVFAAELILKSRLPEHLQLGSANWFS
jgi:ubiquinone/menaquinone biosynthesis C-methylase UbiE